MTRQKEPTTQAVMMHAWCKAVLGHIVEAAKAAGEPLPFAEQAGDQLDRAFARGDERGLKMLVGDFREWASGLPRSRFEAVDKDLAKRFGVGLVDLEKVARREVERILRRGSIGDDAEYRVLESWLGTTGGGRDPQRDMESVRALLVEYDLKVRRGG